MIMIVLELVPFSLMSSDPRLVFALFGGLLLELYPEPFAAIQPFARFGRYVYARAYLPIK